MPSTVLEPAPVLVGDGQVDGDLHGLRPSSFGGDVADGPSRGFLMHRPTDTEEPAGAENPPVAQAPRAPGFWRRIDWPNVSTVIGLVIALLTMFGYGLWRAIDDVDGDVGRLSKRTDGELRDVRNDISVVRGDVLIRVNHPPCNRQGMA